MTGAGQGADNPTLLREWAAAYLADRHMQFAQKLCIDAATEIESLRKALDEYGWHHHKCAALSDASPDMRWPEIACTCGFDAVVGAALSPASGGV